MHVGCFPIVLFTAVIPIAYVHKAIKTGKEGM